MKPHLLLISGAVAAGKSSVASLLIERYGFARISSGDFLRGLSAQRGLATDRASLQFLGDQLDYETDYLWLVDDVAVPLIDSNRARHWLVDAVRKHRQVQHFRRRFGAVIHVHFAAPEATLKRRYVDRLVSSGAAFEDAATNYDEAVLHPNEVEARSLSQIADFAFDTSMMPPEEIAAAIGGDGEESSSC